MFEGIVTTSAMKMEVNMNPTKPHDYTGPNGREVLAQRKAQKTAWLNSLSKARK